MRPSQKNPARTQWSESLRRLRKEHHVSQRELAVLMKVAKATISGIESGLVRTPSFRTQRKLNWAQHHFAMKAMDRELEYINKLRAVRAAKGKPLPAPINQHRVAIGA
jgi:DNA-binding XRE family transcriptional regulator